MMSVDCCVKSRFLIVVSWKLEKGLFLSTVSEEKSKISQPIRGQGFNLVFLIGTKNTNLVEDIEIMLPVKFCWIPFSSFRGEVENVSANQRPGRPSCYSDRPKKQKLGRECWDLASCQISLSSVQRFQRSWKSLSQSEARAAILFFRSTLKNKNLVEDVEFFLSSFVEFCSAVSEEKSKMWKDNNERTDDGLPDAGRLRTDNAWSQ